MYIRSWVMLIFILIFCSNIIHAHSKEPYNGLFKDTESLNPLLDGKDLDSKITRIEVAKSLLNNLAALKKLIPEISAISKKNLNEQKNAIHNTSIIDNNKINDNAANEVAKNIISYSKNRDHYSYEIYNEIEFIINNLNEIVNSVNKNKEMYYWTNVAIGLTDINVWQPNMQGLVDEHLIDKSFGDSEIVTFYKIYHGWGEFILINIISPYLRNLG